MTNKKSTTKATARQEPSIPTRPGFYWIKIGYWQPCEVRDLGANGLRVWFLGVPHGYTFGELAPPGRSVEWGPEITLPVGPGWRFVAWKGKLTGPRNPAVIAMDRNKLVTAVFEQY